jgi:hypothetical protein
MKRLLLIAALSFAFAVPQLAGATAEGAAPSETTVAKLVGQAPGLRPEVLRLALGAAGRAAARGLVVRRDVLTVIDYSLPSSEPRLFVFDLTSQRLLFRELVAHGKNSGGDRSNHFSNEPGSLETSLGLFVTAETYIGNNGYSLRLRGLEEGINDMAWDRAIVMHGASYVSGEAIRALGRLGRSWGCPALRPEVARKVIDTVRGGSAIFAYYPETAWLAASHFVSPALHAAAPAGATVSHTLASAE